MRNFIIIALIAMGHSVVAQDNIIYSNDIFPVKIEQQTELLKQLIPEIQSEKITLRNRHSNNSNYSYHYTFDVLFNQLPVFTNFIKVNTNKANKIISIAKGIGSYGNYTIEKLNSELDIWEGQKLNDMHWKNNEIINNSYNAIFELEGLTSVVQVQEAWSKTYDKTKLLTLANEVIAQWNHQRKLGIDTFINANIFEPDPLTFLSKMYGSPYIDSNDQDLPWMNAAYVPVNIPAIYDTFVNKFFIENDYVKIDDFEPPLIVPASSSNNNFYFNRSESGFEECMIAYHINKFHNHIASLGYDTLMDLQLEADAHGQFGADNSTFNRNNGSPTIIFGDGGIDDAEDADVIIHEYCHGISWSANQNLFFGVERPALDEGIADYFATSYSRYLSPFNWQKVFNWDGNNGGWQGRTANTSANYSNPFPGNLYALGEVWNAAMQQNYDDLGRNITDELMLEALFFLTDSSTLPDAARYMMQADSLLNGGINSFIICQNFASKGILAWDCFPVGMNDINKTTPIVVVHNSAGFNNGESPVIFRLHKNEKASLQLFDINGRLLIIRDFRNGELKLSPATYSAGIYIAQINSSQGVQTIKLSRQ